MNSFGHLVAVLGLAVAGAAVAQPPDRSGGPRFDIERLTILLDLDAYQRGEVERVLNEQREQNQAARAALTDTGERPTREEMQARRVQSQADLVARLEAVLTPQQVTKFKVLTEQPEGRGGRGPSL